MTSTVSPESLPIIKHQQGIIDGAKQVLQDLAATAMNSGVSYQSLRELLKQALVDAADRNVTDVPPHRRVSSISSATGIHRREVSRILTQVRDGKLGEVPLDSMHISLMRRWSAEAPFTSPQGVPLPLPLRGDSQAGRPGFDDLASDVTLDVHHSAILRELLRLRLVSLEGETVVPQFHRNFDDGADAPSVRTPHRIQPPGPKARVAKSSSSAGTSAAPAAA